MIIYTFGPFMFNRETGASCKNMFIYHSKGRNCFANVTLKLILNNTNEGDKGHLVNHILYILLKKEYDTYGHTLDKHFGLIVKN
jgi:hypothetical protein